MRTEAADGVFRTMLRRYSLLWAAALVAAAVGDFVVEHLANAGVFGKEYSDHNQMTVVPTLVCGALIAAQIAIVRTTAMVRRGRGEHADASAEQLWRPSMLRDLPVLFALQLLALFAMESCEQLLTNGQLLGRTAWLGGPLVASLAIHALCSVVCALVMVLALRVIVTTCALLVIRAFAVFIGTLRDATAAHCGRGEPPCTRAASPHVRQLGERAPPSLHVVTA